MATSPVPSLVDICLDFLAFNLETVNLNQVSLVPTSVARGLLDKVRSRFSGSRHLLVRQLQILTHSWLKPCSLELPSHPLPLYLPGLGMVASSLRVLDLSSCSWMTSLYGVQSLTQLQCLKLNGNHHVAPAELAYVSAVPSLRCLELQNWSSLNDETVLPYLYSIPGLTSLNLSDCPVGDALLEGLAYGLRLANWKKDAEAAKAAAAQKREKHMGAKRKGENLAADAFKKAKEGAADAWAEVGEQYQQQQQQEHPGGADATGSGQWPQFTELAVLRLRNTRCSKQGAANLTVFPKLSCLDLRGTFISRHFLQPLLTKQKLSCSPNEPLLLAPSNKTLLELQKGKQCGCSLLGSQASAQKNRESTGTSGVSVSSRSPSCKLSSSRTEIRCRLDASSEELKQWEELCRRGALAYLETAGAEAALGRYP